MKPQKTIFWIVIIALTASCNSKKETKSTNPFFTEYDTPFQAPPFDKIDTTHYMPAFEEGMKQQNAEVDSIANSTTTATFENTILPFDKSGKLLNKVSYVFFQMTDANTNKAIQSIANKISPLLSTHRDNIYMNAKLFKRIKAVYDKRKEMKLDSQQIRAVEKHYLDFVRLGANLTPVNQDSLKKINAQLSTLTLKFGDNVLADTKAFQLIIDKKEDLDGLPQTSIDAAAAAAKEAKLTGKWLFTLDKPSMIPFLQYSTKRDLREKIYKGYYMRGNNGNTNDNKTTIAKIANLRQKKAELLGYKSCAAYIIDDNMAKTPEKVDEFLMKLWKAAIPVAKTELADMQKMIDKEGGKFKLATWDWWFYAEKVRKERYNVDENDLKPYFSLTNVRDGMFYVATQLYGITFTKLTNLPVYNADVETYQVKEASGKHLGILYLDYYVRDSKRGGAWCSSFMSAGWDKGKKVDPIVPIVFNFTKPAGTDPALLTWDETTTMFHEFGHALHGLFAEGKYNRTAGNVPTDYVELPSQVMENWAGEEKVMKHYAKHYKTGAVIPDSLIKKIQKSSKFNQGFITVEYLAAALLDLDYHNLTKQTDIDVEKFEKAGMDKIGLIPEILPRYRSTYFNHVFSGGYAAGYYVYIWAAVLDADAFDAFVTSGDIYNKTLAAKFRKYCLQESGDGEGMDQYRKFRGKDPSVDALLKRRGLN